MRRSIIVHYYYPALLTVPLWLVIGRKTVALVSVEESVGVTSDNQIQLRNVLSQLYVNQVAGMSQSNNNLNPVFFQFPTKTSTHSFFAVQLLPCFSLNRLNFIKKFQFSAGEIVISSPGDVANNPNIFPSH